MEPYNLIQIIRIRVEYLIPYNFVQINGYNRQIKGQLKK